MSNKYPSKQEVTLIMYGTFKCYNSFIDWSFLVDR